MLSPGPTFAETRGDYNITNYNIGSGLTTNRIFDSAQDSLGRMWFATSRGASVYDGYGWTNYDLLDNVNQSGFKEIIVDKKGLIWLAPLIASDFIFVRKGGEWVKFSKVQGISNNSEFTTGFDVIYLNNHPVITLTTHIGAFLYIDGNWQKFDKSNSTLSGEILGVTSYGEKFFLATRVGLSTIEFDKTQKVNIQNNVFGISDPVFAIHINYSDKLVPRYYILSSDWIGTIEDNNLQKTSLPAKIDFMRQFPYYYISVDKDEKIYFGNKVTKYLYEKASNSFYALDKNAELASDGATSAMVDIENNIWFTDLRGVDKISFHLFTNFTIKSGLLENEVTAILEYEPGNFIFGHNSGYSFYKDGKINACYFTGITGTKTIVSRLLDLAKDDEGNIWGAAGYYGLVKINRDGSHTRVVSPGMSITSVLFDKKIGLIVASDSGIFRLERSNLVKIDTARKERNCRKLFRFGDKIYAASIEGIFEIHPNKTINIIPRESVFDANVFSMLQDSDGTFFVGSESGLFTLENNKLKKFEKNGFSISKSVYFIVKSNDGNFWFGTIDGLTRWDGKNTVYDYSIQDGLAGYEMNRSAAVIDSKNVFWIGTNTGLSAYKIGSKRNKVAPPNIVFLNVETGSGEKYDLSKDVVISHNDNSLNFVFRGISFISESSIEYRIKLEGFDKDFYTISQSQLYSIRYPNLPSGSYRLVIMTKNRFSNWSEPAFSKTIVIERPFYFKLWFILLTLITVAGLAILVNVYYIAKKEQAHLEVMVDERTKALRASEEKLKSLLENLEEEVRQRTDELDKLNKTKDKIFSIISHDLRSPFMSILGFSEILDNEMDEMDTATIKSYLGKILSASRNSVSLVDGLLEWSRLQIGGVILSYNEVDMNAIIEEVRALFHPQLAEKSITLSVVSAESVKIVTDANIVRSVLRNLVSNAIKFTRKGGFITISLTRIANTIQLSVKDSGIGIPSEMIPKLFGMSNIHSRKGTSNEKGTGLGLNIAYEFIQKLGGQITVESEEGKGTKFTVFLPADHPTEN
ncbi:hypothetical protein MASR1M107_03270 [Ignavibacteriales bacterium]